MVLPPTPAAQSETAGLTPRPPSVPHVVHAHIPVGREHLLSFIQAYIQLAQKFSSELLAKQLDNSVLMPMLALGKGLAVQLSHPLLACCLQFQAASCEVVTSVGGLSAEEAERQAEAEERAWYLRTVNAFCRLAVLLRKSSHFNEFTQLPALASSELKRLLVVTLRSELQWAGRRLSRELEVLYRPELERDSADWDKVGAPGAGTLSHASKLYPMSVVLQPAYVILFDFTTMWIMCMCR
jgi:hypothetical protein